MDDDIALAFPEGTTIRMPAGGREEGHEKKEVGRSTGPHAEYVISGMWE